MKIHAFGDLKRSFAAFIQRLSTKHGLATLLPGKAARRSGSRWRLIWPLALACGFLIFVIGSSILLVRSSQTTGELVKSTLRVETKLWIVLDTLGVAESGQRGYLLTGEREYLDVFFVAKGAIESAVTELKATIVDPVQHVAFAAIQPLIERKFAELDETIRLYDAGQGAEALALVRQGGGRALMTEIRGRSQDMLETEQHFLQIRSLNSSWSIRWLLVVDLIGLALIIALSVASIVVVRRLAETERSYLGELERSNQDLDDFAYIASHDLKEPLRGLFNHAAFLLEDYADKIDEDGVRRLNRLGSLCQRMEWLINDLMYFARLGRADLAIGSTDPNAVIVEIRHMMETLLSERGARIIVPLRLPLIVCDRTGVTEVFRNLITNAIKYNDNAEPLVEIGFMATVDTGTGPEKNVFYVRDNGVGIDPEFHQVIFRIFKRLQNTPDGQDSGTGSGLTFVKKIVERHGGRVWLDSEPGTGTVFYFSLNCGRNEPERNLNASAVNAIPVHSAG